MIIDSDDSQGDLPMSTSLGEIGAERRVFVLSQAGPGPVRINTLAERTWGLSVWSLTECKFINSHDAEATVLGHLQVDKLSAPTSSDLASS